MDDENVDPIEYVRRASEYALGGVNHGLDRHGGRLDQATSWWDHVGYWLQITASVPSRPDAVIRWARVLLSASGPDKDAELSGMIYGVAFTEDLDTRLKDAEAVDGVITL